MPLVYMYLNTLCFDTESLEAWVNATSVGLMPLVYMYLNTLCFDTAIAYQSLEVRFDATSVCVPKYSMF